MFSGRKSLPSMAQTTVKPDQPTFSDYQCPHTLPMRHHEW